MDEKPQKKDYMLPMSILCAAILISLSVIYSAGKQPSQNAPLAADIGGVQAGLAPTAVVKPISAADHVLGSLSAPIKIIEYSDFECPWCKKFHETMKQVVASYAGKVAWVYRHFPLHSKASKEAEASECAAEVGGNNAFWQYIDRMFQITPSNDGLDLKQLPQIAVDIGLPRDKFEACLNSGKYAAAVLDGRTDAQSIGAQGTPYSLIITPDGKQYPINGYVPYEDAKQMIDQILQTVK